MGADVTVERVRGAGVESPAATCRHEIPSAPAVGQEEGDVGAQPAASRQLNPATDYRYPGLGDGKPGGGAPVTLLTCGGVPVSGVWQDDGRYVAWAPLPERDRAKEQLLRAMGVRI